MSAYGSFLYGSGTKYGTSSASAPRWSFLVDWDEDGFYDSPNEAEYMTGLMIERGRNYYIGANSDRFEPIQSGRATITLSNHDGRYNPYNVSSPLYPNLDSGKFIQLRVKYGTTIYTVFTGVITDIQQTGLNDTVRIVAEDGIRWMTDQIANPSPPISTGMQADEIIYRILDGAHWPALWNRDLGNGSDFYFYWWAGGNNTWEEIKKLLDSELAIYCIRADGSFYYRNRQSIGTSVLSLTEDQLGKSVYIPMPWEFRKNIVKFTGNNISRSAEVIGWQSSGDIAVAPGTSVSITAEFSNPVLPTNNVTYLAFDQSGGVGTDLSANISVEYVTTNAQDATISITNSGAVLAYVSEIKLYAIELTKVLTSGSASGTGSTTRPRSLDMELTWQQNQNALAEFATQMLAFLNTSQPFPVVTIDNRPDIQFTPDLFDVVSVDLTSIGINTSFRVGKITHEWTAETGLATKTTLGLEPNRLYTGYWIFDSNAILDTSLLGW